MKKTIILTLICLSTGFAEASDQSDTTLLSKNRLLACRLMDEGLYDESIALLAAAADHARTALWSYEKALSLAAAGARSTDIPSLMEIRRRFIEIWFASGHNSTYPCSLFDYHRALIGVGHFEAYNYWLFSFGDEAAFIKWFADNPVIKP